MQITANRPAMRSGASSVAFNKKPDLQTFQTAQTSENVTKSDNSAQQTSKQLQAQLLNIGLNINFTA
jgi:hypothetical protein